MRIFIGLLMILAVAAPAAAQQSGVDGNASEIVVRNFIGTVIIEVAPKAKVSLTRTNGTNTGYPVFTEQTGSALVVRSDQDPDDADWWDDVNWRRDRDKAFANFLKSYPTLVFTAPPGTNVSFDSAVILLDAGDINSALSVRDGFVEGTIGDLASADVHINGSGDLITGNIAGLLDLAINGSGDFTAGHAGRMLARINGSGDIIVKNVANEADLDIHGSGDMMLGTVGGAISISTHGSGDIETAAVNGGADISVHGSSDIVLASISGPTSANINGSGDVHIGGGIAENLNVQISGSGEFNHLGRATNPVVLASGSGGVFIREHDGTVNVRGRGDIEISGRDYSNDD